MSLPLAPVCPVCVFHVACLSSFAVYPVCLSPLTFLVCPTTVIQAIQLPSQWKIAGRGASQPGRQLGSPSEALKTCYPPKCILLAYSPDPLSEPPRAAPRLTQGPCVKCTECPSCFISMAPRHAACCFRSLKTRTQINEEAAGNNYFLISSQTAPHVRSLSLKGQRTRESNPPLA